MIRRGQPGDRAALEALYDLCFPGEQAFRSWFFTTLWRPEHTLLIEEGGSIPAATQVIPKQLMLEGQAYPAEYIRAAGTHPEHRGKGLMGQLLHRSFEEGAASGVVFSTLITGNDSLFDFYRPFGYTTLSYGAQAAISPAPLPEGYRIQRAEAPHFPTMAELYAQATRQVAAMVRDGAYFELMSQLYGENLIVLLDTENTVNAYCFTEKREERMFIAEAAGAEMLPRYLAELWGCQFYQRPVAPGDVQTKPMGCIKALTPQGQGLLERLALPPYLNILLN